MDEKLREIQRQGKGISIGIVNKNRRRIKRIKVGKTISALEPDHQGLDWIGLMGMG